jgi:flagella basal body P-ring formation protein FlgA
MKKLLIIATLLSIATFTFAQEAYVQIKDECSLAAKEILLGDVADVISEDPQLAQAIKAIRLGPSPMPGNWREFDKRMVLNQLQRNGYNAPRVKVAGPEYVRLYRQSQVLEEGRLMDQVREFIHDSAPWAADEMEISDMTRTGNITLPLGHLDILVQSRGGDFIGSTPFSVQVALNGEVVKRLLIQANINVFREAVVAVNSVPARNLISKFDVEVRRVNLADARGTYFQNADEVIAMASTTYIRPGQIITTQQVTQPIVIKRGQNVVLTASSQSFVIKTSGVAMENGCRGDIIRIKNPASKTVINAKVTDPGKAEVIF